MAGSFAVTGHTADTGIAVEADTLGELFEWAAIGMFSLMYDIDSLRPQRTIEVVAESSGLDELLVDVLADLLYRSESEDVVPCRFVTHEASPTRVRVEVGVTPLGAEMLEGPPIKAVTYHHLMATQASDGQWVARVIFDV